MKHSTTVLAVCAISLPIIIYCLFKKKSNKLQSQKDLQKYDPNKPQKNFTKYKRDNHLDDPHDFNTPEHFINMKSRIDQIETQKMFWFHDDLELKNFVEDSYEYIDDEPKLKEMIFKILKNDKVIGIDIEQTNLNSYQGYNCLIQISSLDRNYIIDAIRLHDVLPEYLKQICENHSIIKVLYSGVSDIQWLKRDYGVFIVNYFDIYYFVISYEKTQDCSLVGLLGRYCKKNVDKESKKQLQVSDWRRRPLSNQQLNYAALDVHYLIFLREVLIKKYINIKGIDNLSSFLKELQKYCLRPYEPRTFSIESWANIFDQELKLYSNANKSQSTNSQSIDNSNTQLKNKFLALCNLIDKMARDLDTDMGSICSKNFLFDLAIGLPKEGEKADLSNIIHNFIKLEKVEDLSKYMPQLERIMKGESQVNYTEKLSIPKKRKEYIDEAKIQRTKLVASKRKAVKIYEDCRILSPTGELLSYTNRTKINWYLQKGIATLIGENPPTIQLKFKPSGRGPEITQITGDYYKFGKSHRANQCTVCGQAENLSRYHIVPLNYRQNFPQEMKERRALDIVLLCGRCLDKANKEAHKFKNEIAIKYNVPLIEFQEVHQLQGHYGTIKKTLLSFTKHQNLIPEKNQNKMKNDIKKAFEMINNERNLTEAAKIAFRKFESEEDGSVKIDQNFIDFFLNINYFHDIVKKNSNNEHRNIHGKLVVDSLKTKEQIKKFINEWRIHFVASMDPQFLPDDLKIALNTQIL